LFDNFKKKTKNNQVLEKIEFSGASACVEMNKVINRMNRSFCSSDVTIDCRGLFGFQVHAPFLT
jgi:hypothetical protein